MEESSSKVRVLAAEQLAKAQARKEEKLRKQQEGIQKPKITFLDHREWLPLATDANTGFRVKILSWNLLAQCLVRRELFPTSDCLKAGQREPMIHEELLRQDADILCLQEVDRLDKLLPMLEQAGYSHHYVSGPRKKHGCLIAFKKDLYTLHDTKAIYYDDQEVVPGKTPPRLGCSFKTRNIANLVCLKQNNLDGKGLVVATTHLFWHPRYTYERIRQLGIFIREVLKFREEESVTDWPCIVAGDFNFIPSDAAYSLLFREPLLENQETEIMASRVVHFTVDPTALQADQPPVNSKLKAAEDDDEEGDPDRVITKARPAKPEDGLLTIPEIVTLFNPIPKFRSAYAEGLKNAKTQGFEVRTFGDRTGLSSERQGATEPEYTSYTFYWKNVLDYIFFLDPSERATVSGLSRPPTMEDLDPGLPKRRISGSDHTVMVAELNLY